MASLVALVRIIIASGIEIVQGLSHLHYQRVCWSKRQLIQSDVEYASLQELSRMEMAITALMFWIWMGSRSYY